MLLLNCKLKNGLKNIVQLGHTLVGDQFVLLNNYQIPPNLLLIRKVVLKY